MRTLVALCLNVMVLIPLSYGSLSAQDVEALPLSKQNDEEFKTASIKVVLFLSVLGLGAAYLKRSKLKLGAVSQTSDSIEIIGNQNISGGSRITLLRALNNTFVVATSPNGNISMMPLNLQLNELKDEGENLKKAAINV